MADEPEVEHHPNDADEGGPVKSFLDHLEDLRWVLIKSAAAIAVAMLVCLIAAPTVVSIINRPLHKAQVAYPGEDKIGVLMFGTNYLNTFHLTLDQWDTLNMGTNHDASRITPDELVGMKILIERLTDPAKSDLISRGLVTNLSTATRLALTNAGAETNAALRQLVSDDLNRIIRAGPLYDAKVFEDIKLSPETTRLVESKPAGDELVKLNRRLLLHAYPWSISRNPSRFVAVSAEPRSDGGNELVVGLRVDRSADAEKLARQLKVDLNTLSPAGGFFVAFQVAFYGGLAVSSPLILLFIAQFVFPALKIRERHYIYRGLFYSVPLFILGVCFCYYILMPVALSASQLYSNWLGFSASMWRAEDYISFVCKFMLGMGLGFQLPVVLLVLVKIGVLNYRILSRARRYMIVINLVLGAVLTTPEVLTQVLMAVPLQLLYEISVWVAWWWERKQRLREHPELAAKSRLWFYIIIAAILAAIGGGVWYKLQHDKEAQSNPGTSGLTNAAPATATNAPATTK